MKSFFSRHIHGALTESNVARTFKLIEAVGVQLDVFLISQISETLVCLI